LVAFCPRRDEGVASPVKLTRHRARSAAAFHLELHPRRQSHSVRLVCRHFHSRAFAWISGPLDRDEFRLPLRQRAAFAPTVNTFDRHLLREWLQILGLVLAAMCGLLLVQVLYDDFARLRELGARGSVFWEYVLVTIPSFLAIVLPLALLVSLLYALGKLH